MSECCVEHDIKHIDQLIYTLKTRISEDSQVRASDIFYQNGYEETPEARNLLHYLNALKQHRKALVKGVDPCLCCEESEALVEAAKGAVGWLCDVENRVDVVIDNSRYDEWVIQNPQLVTYEEWESCIYDVACKFEINPDAINVHKLCDVLVEIKKLDCSYNPTIDFKKIICDLTPKVDIKVSQCEIEYDVLINKVEACDISFNEFVFMKQCGLDAEVVVEAIACGFDIDISDNSIQICYEGSVVTDIVPGAQ